MSLKVEIKKQLGDFHLDVAFETTGGTLGLLGPSGCGKSYTLKCIAGIEKPDSGVIELDGVTLFDSKKRINLPPQERHVGYLFQNYALFPNMTVRQNILCGLKYEKNRAVKREKYAEMLKILQLEGLENHKPAQLSGGQAQRVALARIMVNQPKLLMLDEPFSALDTHLRDKLQIELKDLLKSFGREVILVSHSRDEAYHMCGSIAVVEDGKILVRKPTKELFANPECISAAILTGCKNIAPAKKLGPHEVEVPEWGVTLQTKEEVGDGLKAVGIRAHYFNPNSPYNRFPVRYDEEMEEPFEFIVLYRYAGQSADSPSVWWRLAKDKRPQEFPKELGVAPANVLLLYS